jgi:hypothetical protein
MVRQCRICFDETSAEKNSLIEPCSCKGSSQYIHELCLKFWIRMNPEKNSERCPVCLSEYNQTVLKRETIPTKNTSTLFILYNPVISGCASHFVTIVLFTKDGVTPISHIQILHGTLQLVFFICFYLNCDVQNKEWYKKLSLTGYMPYIALIYVYYLFDVKKYTRPEHFLTMQYLLTLLWQEHIRILQNINRMILL